MRRRAYIPMRLFRFLFSGLFYCIVVIAALSAAIIFLCFYIRSLLPAAAAMIFCYALSASAAIKLMCGSQPAEFKCAALALLVLFPVGGAVLYFLSSRPTPPTQKNTLYYATANEVYYFDSGEKFLKELKRRISLCRARAYLEFYIIADGKVWRGICDELLKALGRGAEVKIICDGLGGALRAPKKDFRMLRRRGAEVKIINKLAPFPLYHLNARCHRKIAVLDGAVMVGGVNIADEYANLTHPHGIWKDGGALFCGRIADLHAQVFLSDFDGRKLCGDFSKADETCVKAVFDKPQSGKWESAISCAINSARERVYIFTPYLCVGDSLCGTIACAAERGVCVKVILPAIPDKKTVYAVTCAYADKFCSLGAKVYLFSGGFVHMKGILCDDEAFLGSYNFDFRSFRLNAENGVACSALAEPLKKDFESCLLLCREYIPSPQSRIKKLAKAALTLFAPLV